MKEFLPIISIIISVLSLSIAFYVMFRDRIRFDVSGEYKESFANMVDVIYIKIVNSGRRPITLYALNFIAKNGENHKFRITNSINQKAASPFENRDLNHPCLSESQFFEILLDRTNFNFDTFELGEVNCIKIESSTGKSKEVKGLAKIVKEQAPLLK